MHQKQDQLTLTLTTLLNIDMKKILLMIAIFLLPVICIAGNSFGPTNITGQLTKDGADVIHNGYNSNVGLGTTTPSSKLDINNGSITIRGTNAGLNILQGTFTVTTNGNVGINTTSPNAKLHIYETGSSTISLNNLLLITTGTTNLMQVTTTGTVIAQEKWHYVGATGEPAFKNSWGNFDASEATWQKAKFFKDSNGVVHISGLVSAGTINQAVFTLPASYWPDAGMHFATISNDAFAKLQVLINGDVYAATGSNAWYSIECSFKAKKQ